MTNKKSARDFLVGAERSRHRGRHNAEMTCHEMIDGRLCFDSETGVVLQVTHLPVEVSTGLQEPHQALRVSAERCDVGRSLCET